MLLSFSEPATLFCSFERIFIELEDDAMQRLTFFIGRKKYKTLILARVAMKFAFPQDSQSAHYVGANVVRDIYHWRTEKALNKTSKACTRRIQYLVKSRPLIKEQIAFFIEELRTNREFTKYRNLAEQLKKIYNFYKQYLSNQLIIRTSVEYNLSNDYERLLEDFSISNPLDTLRENEKRYRDPKTIQEAEITTLMSLIHSAV